MIEQDKAYPPGKYIKSFLEEKKWSQTDLSLALGWPTNDVSNLILRKKKLTPTVAMELASVIPGTTAQMWIDREGRYILAQAEQLTDDTEAYSQRSKIFGLFPTVEMIKRGWLEKSDDLNNLESQIKNFFEIDSLEETVQSQYAALKTDYAISTRKQDAWIKRARRLAPAIMVGRFSDASLNEAMMKLRPLLYDVESIRQIPMILADAGIRLLIVEPLPGSRISGATFWLDKQSPVVVLSLLFDRIDSFWQTLLHELSHVKNREGQDQPIIDCDLLAEDEPLTEKPVIEQRANQDAAEFSIPKEVLDSFVLRAHPSYQDKNILGFSALNKVHPGILVGQLHYRFNTTGKGLPFSKKRGFLVKVRNIINSSAYADGYGLESLIK